MAISNQRLNHAVHGLTNVLCGVVCLWLVCWQGVAGGEPQKPSTESAVQRLNIVLLVSDDQRPDTIAALGNEHIQTPHLDSLVRRGVSFTRATCANPICTPSRAEILTGCTSFRNHVLDFGRPINPELPTLGDWFAKSGYRTWYVGKWHNNALPSHHGYNAAQGLYRGGGGKFQQPQTDWAGRPITGYRGWLFQEESGKLYPEQGVGLTADISTRFADAAIECLRQSTREQRPFLLHVNFTAPHDPLLLPPGWEKTYKPESLPLPPNFLEQHPFDHGNFEGRDEKLFAWPRTPEEVRGELAAYYAVISHMDAEIGRILQALEEYSLAENTLVVYTSDHGLAVGSHGLRGKQNMYEHTIGVPLLLAGPDLPAGELRTAQCYLRDLFPTLAELAGLPSPGDRIDGLSLVPVLQGRQQEVHPFIVGYFRHFQRMIRTERWKYIEYPAVGKRQLFDLSQDPHELHNLSDTAAHQAQQHQLAEALQQWLSAHHDPLTQQD